MKGIFFVLASVFLMLSCESLKDYDSENELLSISLNVETAIYNGVETLISADISGDVKEVSFFLDGKSVGILISPPYEVKIMPRDLDPGKHSIKCIARTSGNKEFSKEQQFNVSLRLGDPYKGGIIFKLESNGTNGLIASNQDLVVNSITEFPWGKYEFLGTTKSDGNSNTQKMISSNSGLGNIFKNLSINGYKDWFVPSSDELKLLKEKRFIVGGFSTKTNWEGLYWTSTEISDKNAEAINFNALMGNSYDKQSYSLKVRPIRKF